MIYYYTILSIAGMEEYRKIIVFVNEPSFRKNHIKKLATNNFLQHKTSLSIFPHQAHIERFKNLEQGRNKVQTQKQASDNLIKIIADLHQMMQGIDQKNKKLDKGKSQMLNAFKMDLLRLELERDLEKLSSFIKKYSQIKREFNFNREEIEKMTKMTEIRRALTIQNKLLKQENMRLKKQEMELDRLT